MSEELESQIKALAAKMDDVEESVRTISVPYSQLIDHLERFNKIATSYFRLLDLYQRHGEIAPDVLLPGVKDPISREVLAALEEKGVVVSKGTPRSKEYWLTEGYVKRWYELLGLGIQEPKKAP
jgi:hypothetical protein